MFLHEIVDNCQKGNKEYINILINKFSNLINKLAWKMNYIDYEDSKYYIITEFIDSIKSLNLNKYKDCDEKALTSCIAKILIRKQNDYYTKNKKRLDEYPIDLEIYSTTDKSLEQVVDKVYMEQLLNTYLTNKQKYILIQKYYEDKSSKIIAKELGISRQAVNQSVRAGIKKLRKHITEGDLNGK